MRPWVFVGPLHRCYRIAFSDPPRPGRARPLPGGPSTSSTAFWYLDEFTLPVRPAHLPGSRPFCSTGSSSTQPSSPTHLRLVATKAPNAVAAVGEASGPNAPSHVVSTWTCCIHLMLAPLIHRRALQHGIFSQAQVQRSSDEVRGLGCSFISPIQTTGCEHRRRSGCGRELRAPVPRAF